MKVKQLALIANPQVVVVTNTVLPAAGEGSKCSENAKALLCFSPIINHKLLITLKNVVSKKKNFFLEFCITSQLILPVSANEFHSHARSVMQGVSLPDPPVLMIL